MNYRIVLHREFDLPARAAQANLGASPRHVMWQLAQRLGARVHFPTPEQDIHKRDVLASKLVAKRENWALARRMVKQTAPDDVIFCVSEVVGLPLAALYRGRQDRPKIVVFVHNLDRPRGRAALKLLQTASTVDWFIACSQRQVVFLRKYLNLPNERVTFMWDQTDLQFFTPGAPTPNLHRPIVMSVGLEKRDYRTLAEATGDLPVDVRISGFSSDAYLYQKAFPDVMPANMTRKFYEWPDLVQLYRDAAVVVVSTFPNTYAAGVQVLMEAMACERPVIVTQTEGLSAYLAGNEGVIQVPPGNPEAMRAAIRWVLEHPAEAQQLGKRGATLVKERHSSDRFVENFAQQLEVLGQPVSPLCSSSR
jgi:glycosyltransferase involved in cell wall biosynthesis